jgi:nitrilase
MDSADTRLQVAVVQLAPVGFDTAATIAAITAQVHAAARAGAQVVVLPEAIVGGYPKGADFGVVLGRRSEAGRRAYARYAAAAIAVPSAEEAQLAACAAAAKVVLVLGVIERAGRTLYCSALAYDRDGRRILHRRKLVPTGLERVVWGRGDGAGLQAADVGPVTLAAAICWENYMPLLRAALYARGVTLWCAPTVDDREVWLATMRHVAVEGRTFVLSANQYATRADYAPRAADEPWIVPEGDPDELLIGGGSCIVDPFGEVLAGPLRGGPGTLHAVLELGRLREAALDLDVTGHYARPDVLELRVDRRAHAAVRFATDPAELGDTDPAAGDDREQPARSGQP